MNKVTIQPTIFENHPQGTKTFGCRIYDDHGQAYLNTWESIPVDDMVILEKAIDGGDETADAMFDFLLEHCHGIYIGNQWYEWGQIRHLFE